ncbi:MAG: hypothetical protein FJ095_12755 [Deltaproteobacteria bacterium]|nr:hypothetical protein [Deltaproteobacteria bacterium]
MQKSRPVHLVAAATLAAAFVLAGCSIGTGVVPNCNLDGSDPDCDPGTKCDDGQGGLKVTPECCRLRGNDEYNLTCMAESAAGSDYTEKCPTNLSDATAVCCTAARNAENKCLGK